MILDDLHWADQPSFNLLQKIVREGLLRAVCLSSPFVDSLSFLAQLCRKPAQDVAPFFLLGGYRDNEVTDPAHPFWMFFEELRSKHISTTNILLQV
jgi:predicted ATPase